MVAPIVKKSYNSDMSLKKIWIPEGIWFEKTSGRLYFGPKII